MDRDALSKEKIVGALEALSAELANRDTKGEICLFGGTVMVLAYSARLSTKDVDAIFHPSQTIRESALKVAEKLDLPENWLNDAAKGYISAKHETVSEGLPQFPNLHLVMPTPEYPLAMKCMASRIGTTNREEDDVRDIIFLIRHLKLKSAETVMEIVTSYYPPQRVPVMAQYLAETLFEEGRI